MGGKRTLKKSDFKEDPLKRLNVLRQISIFRNSLNEYREAEKKIDSKTKKLFPWKEDPFVKQLRYYNTNTEDKPKIEVGVFAKKLMKYGKEKGDAYLIYHGAKLYEKIGHGKKIVPQLLKSVEESVKKQPLDERSYRLLTHFIEENSPEKKESLLENKVGIFMMLLIGGAGISRISSSITGNVVNNSTQTNSSLIGIIFLIMGLVGAFLYFKKR